MAQVLVTTNSGQIVAQWDEIGTSILGTDRANDPDFIAAIERAEALDREVQQRAASLTGGRPNAEGF